MSKWKRTKWQTMSYKTPHWKLKTEQHELHWKLGVNSGRVSSSRSTGGNRRVLQLQTRTPLKTKDRAARTPLKTKDQATRTPLKTKDRATRTPLKTGGEFRKGKQFLVHWCHPSCCSSYKPGDKSWMRKNREVLTTSRTYP
jgi:hypothetical protein